MKPVWKWIIGIFAVLIILVVAGTWYLGRNWKPMVESKLKELIHDSSNGLYSLRYDELDLNIALGNITLTNAELIPDSAVYRQLVDQKEAPDSRFHVKLQTLKIRRVGILEILTNKRLSIKNILLDNPSIELINEYHAYNDTVPEKKPKTLYEKISKTLKEISVDNISLNNVDFKFTNIGKDKRSEMQLDSLQLTLKDLLIDENSESDSSRIFYTKMFDIVIPAFEYDLPDDIYSARFEDLHVNTRENFLEMSKVKFAPKISKSAFFKRKKLNLAMMVMDFEKVKLNEIDFIKILKEKKIKAGEAILSDGGLSIYMDRRYPRKPGSRIGEAPHQKLMNMKQILDIDTVRIENVNILYSEFSAKYFKEGILTFNNANGVLTNVTNDTLILKKDKWMRADLRAKIMNSGSIHAVFGFDMLSKNGAHTYKGSLGAMQATAFNKILKPLLNVEIASGNIHKITFNMQGTDYRNWGDFRFNYDNLKVNLLNEEGSDNKKSKKSVLSFLVNQIIINDSNPDANEVYHIGKINYKRDSKHSFFKTLWQSLLEGIKQSAGISAEREERLTGAASAAQEAVKGTKEATKETKGFFKRIFKKKDKKSEK